MKKIINKFFIHFFIQTFELYRILIKFIEKFIAIMLRIFNKTDKIIFYILLIFKLA